MNVLILSCNTGEGHNSAAKAVRTQLERLEARVEMVDALAFLSSGFSKLVSSGHVFLYKHTPELFGAGYGFLDDHPAGGDSAVYRINALYAKRLEEFILEGGYEAVVCTHVFAAQAITQIYRRKEDQPFTSFLIHADYTCWPFTCETRLDYYFVPCQPVVPQFTKYGIPERKLLVAGIPIAEPSEDTLTRADARASLDLPEKGPLVMLMSGSMGVGPTEELALALARRLPENGKVITLCGNNKALKEHLEAYHDPKILPLGFTHRVSAYMDACDVLVSKGGGLTATEAAAKGIPLVHMDAIPGCETHNVRLFGETGMSIRCKTVTEAANAVIGLLRDPEARQKMVRKQHELINPHAARDIARLVLEKSAERRHGAKA